ncbi:XRE family transcriptional regulator [Limibacillus halophilus]|uniref:Phage repressor protein C with HTH and peptisase S24 domain n=1 Tax=Limibacillus halophilus TaxID=1579333 RepID=A0A839SSX5_9PROT|nr:S24 family peptidase [Limibacillus halophilus]MBB3065582.1 phage repressor protein C with HTH and peptisase S24 domain [Limibacillus halophilus]
MTKLAEIVRQRRREIGLSQPQLARRVGVSAQAVQQMEAGEVRRPRYLVELANALGLEPVALHEGRRVVMGPGTDSDTPLMSPHRGESGRSSEAPRGNAAFPQAMGGGGRDLPVYASAQGGPDGMMVSYDPIEWIERPAPLAGVPSAFAMYVVNDSMEPRYRQGDLLLIHPQRPVRRGADVLLVMLSDIDDHEAYIKELVSVTVDNVTLRQLNPDKTFSVPRDRVAGLHLVVGAYYGY